MDRGLQAAKDIPPYKMPPLQDGSEHRAFIEILRSENVRSYLEIGSMWGASLWCVAMAMPKASRIVAVDSMVDKPEALGSLLACIEELNSLGYDAHFINGDSTKQKTVNAVKALGPFDALFIDGNHSPGYVLSDWQNYGPMARIVGFHDINWNNTWKSARGNTPPADGSTMGAAKIWNEVKQGHRFEEFKLYPSNNYYGIGVLWRIQS
jgi:hypothetical protein